MRLDTNDEPSALKSVAYRTPCLSANIVGDTVAGITEQQLVDRAELRLRAVGLSPIPWTKCEFRDIAEATATAKTATEQQMRLLWVAVEPYFRNDGTFEIQVDVFRIAKWPVADARPGDDGFRGRLLKVDSDQEPQIPLPRYQIRHEGKAGPVFDALDRLMDRFLVDYLRQNEQNHDSTR